MSTAKHSTSWKLKAGFGALAVFALLAFLAVHRQSASPLPNSPVPLRELIDESTTIVFAKVEKVEIPKLPLPGVTNRWVERMKKLLPLREQPIAIGHLQVRQTVKGRATDKALLNVPESMRARYPRELIEGTEVIAFLMGPPGNFRPVAASYGIKKVRGKESDALLKLISEYVEIEKLSGEEKERRRAEWLVRLIENSEFRWDGAAGWIGERAKPGDALCKLPAELVKQVEAVAFRDEVLGAGDELLLRELSIARPKEVIERLRRYFAAATATENLMLPTPDKPGVFKDPWRCLGAMTLLCEVAGMSEEFRRDLEMAPLPNLSTAKARGEFIGRYLPAIESRLAGRHE
jgi:hypothetical protein